MHFRHRQLSRPRHPGRDGSREWLNARRMLRSSLVRGCRHVNVRQTPHVVSLTNRVGCLVLYSSRVTASDSCCSMSDAAYVCTPVNSRAIIDGHRLAS